MKHALEGLDPLSMESVELMKTVKNLSSDPNVLPFLSIFIEPLLSITQQLVKTKNFAMVKGNEIFVILQEVVNPVINTLYALCKKSRHRQEVAAKIGLIPFLLFVYENNRPLREFAVPLLCKYCL